MLEILRLALVPFGCLIIALTPACSPASVGRGGYGARGPTAPGAFDSVAAGGPDAALTISNLSITVVEPVKSGESFYYHVTFELTEATGKSGAAITRIETSVDTGHIETMSPFCLEGLRVPPGGTLHSFDAGSDDFSDCAPWTASAVEGSRLTVAVAFLDDNGRYGVVRATFPVPK